MSIMSAFAKYYDLLLDGVDYPKIADFIECMIRKYAPTARNIVDVSCGTGTLAVELAGLGYDVTASDISDDMLSLAFDKAQKAKAKILFLNQNMRDLTLSVQTDVIISTLDSTNCLIGSGDIDRYFYSVSQNLVPGGLFIFDVNTEYQFEQIYADNDYVLEADGVMLAWRNFYDSKQRKCHFDLSFFCKEEDGRYTRIDEYQCERLYSDRFLKTTLRKYGFDQIEIFSDLNGSGVGTADRRHYFVAKKNCEK